MPKGYAVPGQHDLPYHRYEDIHKSAYWTLAQAGVVENLPPGIPVTVDRSLSLCGYPWGHPVQPAADRGRGTNLAVVHSFIWTKSTGHPGADEGKRVRGYLDKLIGYDAAVFGDNHKPFEARAGRCNVFNGGTFVRRRTDEKDVRPGAGLLMKDGTWRRVHWDTTLDEWADANDLAVKVAEAAGISADRLLEELGAAADTGLNFAKAVFEALDDQQVGGLLRELVLKCLDDDKGG